MGILFIVDDDTNILSPLSYWFTRKGYDVGTFENSSDLLSALQTKIPDFILLDVNLCGELGTEICLLLKRVMKINCPIFLWSAQALKQNEYSKYDADGFILKPVDIMDLTNLIASYMAA